MTTIQPHRQTRKPPRNVSRMADAGRLADIVVTVGRHQIVAIGQGGRDVVAEPRRVGSQRLAIGLRRAFTELGPTFIKLGQLVASSPGLFPDLLSLEFRRLLDSLPPERPEVVQATLRTELRQPLGHVFAEFDYEPIAAASIGQVHAAYLKDGTKVAVKVRRPGLRTVVDRDLRLLALGARALEKAGTAGSVINPAGIVEDFKTTLRAEIDFRNEARWMRAFEENLRSFGSNERIIVPKPVDGLVTERVLVMEFIDGVSIDDRAALHDSGHDLPELLRTGVRAWLEAALEHGLFHGDVHAGNIFVTPDGHIAFLDFGITGTLPEVVRDVLRHSLPPLLIVGDVHPLVTGLGDLGVTRGDADLGRVEDEVREFVQPMLNRPLAEIAYSEVLLGVLRVAFRHRLQLPRELVLIVKQLIYFERYAKELAPDYRILADPSIVEFVAQQMQQPATGSGPRP